MSSGRVKTPKISVKRRKKFGKTAEAMEGFSFIIYWTNGVQFPADIVIVFFSLRHRVQTDCEVHPASYPLSTGSSYSGSRVTRA
jgi:hypothetical protein